MFCCPGCATVHAVLQRAGLGEYYAVRREMGGELEPTTRTPARERDFAHLDDAELLREHGFVPGEVELRLAGLHCAACVWVLERLPRALPGVLSARVDFGASTLTLRWDPARVRLAEIARFVHDLGYPPRLAAAESAREATARSRRVLWRLGVTGALAGNTMLAAFALYAGELSGMDVGFERMFAWLGLAFAVPAVTWGAWPFYVGAWAGLRMRVLHMDLPIALGIAAGFCASAWNTITGAGDVYFDTVTILVFLLLVGRHLQAWGQERVRTRHEIMDALVPGLARREEGGDWIEVKSDRLAVGDRIRVEAEERFPADGEITFGRSHIDLSILTGESVPEPIGPGSSVFAGATNIGATVDLVVTRAGRASRIGTIVGQLCADDARPAPIVRLADRIAGWFVLAVLVLAATGGVVWSIFDSSRAFDVVVALLVVSCPCALGLATPMALSVARGRAGRHGIVLRSAGVLEAFARTRRVVLDKTGTLTEGRLEVVAHELPDSILGAVAALERRSRHPIARAIAAWAKDAPECAVEDFTSIAGAGVQARVDGALVRIGSAAWIGGADAHPAVRAAVSRARTPIVVEVDGAIVGVLAVADRLRPEAREVIARLRAAGKSVAIASGDHPAVVQAVAAELGITDAVGGCSPEAKAELVARAPSIMVGDGINDALAMQRATGSIAVRGGTEAALAVADAYLASGDLASVAELVEGARATQRAVLRNLAFSLAYNVLFASLALAGEITPLVAAILMPISSLTVIVSSLVASTFGPPRPQALRAPASPAAQSLPVTARRTALSEG